MGKLIELLFSKREAIKVSLWKRSLKSPFGKGRFRGISLDNLTR